MDIRQLQYFVRIADEGSITGAARSLHMSQPPLSMQMKLLEEELGVILLKRGSRKAELTEEGTYLYAVGATVESVFTKAPRKQRGGATFWTR